MPAFDWLGFLSRNRIEYFERGPNVARGNVNIRCPWCGSGDQSGHLGISIEGKGWGCWRDQRHRGRAPARLIQALIGCTFAHALELSGSRQSPSPASPEAFFAEVSAMLRPDEAPAQKARKIEFPPEIVPLRDKGLGAGFYDYMEEDRGYAREDIPELTKLYGLRFATRGQFAYRIVFPVEGLDGLLSWTGRAIGDAEVRYKSLSADPKKAEEAGLPCALLPINSCLFNEAELLAQEDGWKTLVISEGPFDALRLDYFGFGLGMRATCLFGLSIYARQLELLATISDRYENKVLLLDRGTTAQALAVGAALAPLGFRSVTLTDDKDPGEMSERAVIKLAKKLAHA